MSEESKGQQAGNYYQKYKAKRRADGKLCLDDPLDDLICRVIADGVAPEDVPEHLIDEGVTADRVADVLSRPQSQKRIGYLKKQAEKDIPETPETPDECLKYVKASLVRISQESQEEKNKITALTALHKVSMDERTHKPADKVVAAADPDLAALEALRGGSAANDRAVS